MKLRVNFCQVFVNLAVFALVGVLIRAETIDFMTVSGLITMKVFDYYEA